MAKRPTIASGCGGKKVKMDCSACCLWVWRYMCRYTCYCAWNCDAGVIQEEEWTFESELSLSDGVAIVRVVGFE